MKVFRYILTPFDCSFPALLARICVSVCVCVRGLEMYRLCGTPMLVNAVNRQRQKGVQCMKCVINRVAICTDFDLHRMEWSNCPLKVSMILISFKMLVNISFVVSGFSFFPLSLSLKATCQIAYAAGDVFFRFVFTCQCSERKELLVKEFLFAIRCMCLHFEEQQSYKNRP